MFAACSGRSFEYCFQPSRFRYLRNLGVLEHKINFFFGYKESFNIRPSDYPLDIMKKIIFSFFANSQVGLLFKCLLKLIITRTIETVHSG